MAMPQEVFARVMQSGVVTAADVTAIRQGIYPDMAIGDDEAEALCKINDFASQTCGEWRTLFVEALCDYVVRQQEPAGYVDEAKADWLQARIMSVGRVRGDTELELLIHVLELADSAPPELSKFALDKVRDDALDAQRAGGDGPTLTTDEVDNLRRVLYAFSGDGGAGAISRDEAEILFDLNDAARDRANDPAWTGLFSKAIGSSILAAMGYVPPSRAEAVRRQAWLTAKTEGVPSFLANMVKSVGTGEAFGRRKADDALWQARAAALEASARAAAPVSEDEAAWLISRIGRDGVLDANEVALLLFVAAEAEGVHPALQTLIDEAKARCDDLAERAEKRA
jgi:hypothetical protein